MEKDIDNIIDAMRALPTNYLFMLAFKLDLLILERDAGYQAYINEQTKDEDKPKRPMLSIVKTED